MKKTLIFSTIAVLAIAIFASSFSAAFAANANAKANGKANAKANIAMSANVSATSSASSTVKSNPKNCSTFVPPGHFFAPGWLKKLLGIAPTLSNCQILPPGIAKKMNGNGNGTSTPPQADVTAPSVPMNFTATATSTSRVDLAWSASTDNVAVVGYRIFRNGVLIATTTATAYADMGLSASTAYIYTVKAVDAAGNLSAQSSSVTVTTFALPAISQISATTTANSATITWATNVPSNSQVSYGLTAGYGSTASNGALVTSHSATITGLSASTTFHYQVKSVDAFGNTATSSNSTFVTLGL